MMAPTTSAMICIEVRQSCPDTSQAASGDIVIGVNQRPVSKLADLRDLLSGAGAQPLVLTLLRGKAAYTLQVN